MSRSKHRDRGTSFSKEELTEENASVLIDRFLTGISSCYTNGITQIQLRQIVDTLNALVKNVSLTRSIPATNEPSVLRDDHHLLQGFNLGLLSPSVSVRAASARALRYLIVTNREFSILVKLNANISISRCVDTVTQSNVDYFQVIRLISSLYRLASSQCPKEAVEFFGVIISSCCSSILQEPVQWQPGLHKSSKYQVTVPRKLTAEIISEACLTAPVSPLSLPTPQMLHSLMTVTLSESFYFSINEAIVSVFVHLLNYPHTRRVLYSSGCLEMLIAKFSDDTMSSEPNSGPNQLQNDEKVPSFHWKAAQFTLTKLFHSCPGAWALLGGNYCRELLNGLAPPMGFEPGADDGGFFITSRISAKRITRQRELLALLAAIFNIETPQWTTNVSLAILSTDPRKYDESWTISEGFIASEAEDLLKFSFSQRVFLTNPPPDPASTLMALILSAFVEAHLITALCIFSMSCLQYSFRGTRPAFPKGGVVQSDPHFIDVECLGVQAAVILAHILYQAKLLLSNGSSALDEIEECVAAFHNNVVTSEHQEVVRTIFDVINQTDSLLSAAANKPSSLHLELLLRYCPKITAPSVATTGTPVQLTEIRPRSQSSTFAKQLLELTGLLTTVPAVDAVAWPSIRLFLSLPSLEIRRSVSEGDIITACRNLATFYKTAKNFCHTDVSSALRNGGRVSSQKSKNYLADIAHCAISLIDFLLATPESSDSAPSTPSLGVPPTRADYYKIAGDLISDICKSMNAIATSPQCSVGENNAGYISLGSLPRVGAQFWFLILGACTSSPYRHTLLEMSRAFDVFRLFLNNSQSMEVMRLALSFLNFAASEPSRQLLAAALKSPEDELRLYAVRILVCLWRRIDDPLSFADWAVPLIAPLIVDTQWCVSDSAVNALLDTILPCPVAGTVIRSLKPAFRLSETSHRLLYGSCLVSPGAWQMQGAKEAVNKELDFWMRENYHIRYSRFCDEMFMESFSGCFSRQPGGVEHYSNLKSGRKLRLPGRHFPPSIFKLMARTQLGIHFLNMKTTEFVRRCCDIVSYYASVDASTEQTIYSNEMVASIRGSICLLANISSNPLGADWLASSPNFGGFDIVAAFHALAQKSPVFSIRGTALMGLSGVADCVDPETLVNCQWVDQRRRANLVPFSACLVSPQFSPVRPLPRRQTCISVPDICIESEYRNGRPMDINAVRRRSSTTDIPPITPEPSSLSSSSSSVNSVGDSGRTPLHPAVHAMLNQRSSLPVTRLQNSEPSPLPPKSPQSRNAFGKFSILLKRSLSKPSIEQNQEFFPSAENISHRDNVPMPPLEKSNSFDLLAQKSQSGSTSAEHSEAFYPSGSGDTGSVQSLNILDFSPQLDEIKAMRSASFKSCGQPEKPRQTKAFFQATAEMSDSHLAASVFYLPTEKMTSFGQVVTGVFLPKKIAELLQDPITSVPEFIRPATPLVPRKMSIVSMSSNANSHSGNNSRPANAIQQWFPAGEASDMISEHNSSQCLICCLTNNDCKLMAIPNEWQQVLWMVVSLQIWPNRTPKMLQSYFAHNHNLARDGCLYSEVVNLMSKIALARFSRQFVHSLFDTMSFSQLIVAARELHPSVV